MRYAYECEKPVDMVAIAESKIHALQSEIKRISETTLRGNFRFEDDRLYWIKKLKSLNSELDAYEEILKENRKQSRKRK